jgi:branched-subunit amino acid aminotransferase/4-amino-4-deoxychorismate lyase
MGETIEKQVPVATESSSVTIYPSALQDAAAIKDGANAALANRDPKGLINSAQQMGLNTPEGNATLKTAQEMQERANNFSKVIHKC